VQSARLTSIVGKAKQTLVTSSIDFDKEKHILTLTFPEVLPVKSTGTLSIDFTGILNDEMCGFYRSSYEDKDGNKKYMAVTQFESTDARRSFPCWDEPAIKATFDVTLNVPRELTALSNMNVVSTTDVEIEGKSLKSVVFAKTPLMSTYLLAFAVGEFDYIEAKSSGEKNGQSVLCRVYTPPGKTEEGEFALSITTQIIEYFADIFGQPYPLPKMDLLAVPDFEAGAMENWGLVTFRNVLLLWNKQSSSVRAKLNVATVVAHELAHQWFGNLVTMDWWSDLWLNEGFATWVGWLAVDHLFPEWEVWNQFVDEVVQSGLNLDSLRSSHPIEVPVKDAAEIPQIFDNISYNKGGSVIRMLSNYMGRDVFLAGIRRYLKKHAFANASTNDLWAALSEESGMDISEFMTLWTRYIGYPIITVKEVDEKSFTARQNRFLSSGDVKEEEDKHLWWVPLALATEAGKVDPEDKNAYVLTTREATFEKPAHETFYKLNRRLTGVYRVHYAKEHLANLAAAIRKGAMTETTDRISILSDAGALAACGAGSTADVLALLDSFENEEEFLVWREVSTRIHDISTIWFEQPEAERAALDRMSARLFGKQVDRLGWESKPDESFLTTQLRTLAISRAGNTNHQG
jgi:aminopeptidase 2